VTEGSVGGCGRVGGRGARRQAVTRVGRVGGDVDYILGFEGRWVG
jgi:hypothetical protein